jgi:hypothetical protein
MVPASTFPNLKIRLSPWWPLPVILGHRRPRSLAACTGRLGSETVS